MAELVTKYQQYAEYKNSGVEWLGEIPKDWQVVRLKYIAELSGNKTSGSANQYVGLENVESKTGKFKVTEGIVSEGVSNTFEKDNLLFGKLRPYLAKSWLASFSGICSSEFLVLDSKLIHPKFLKYMTLTDEFIEQVNSSTYGTKMPRASWDFIGLLQLPVMDYDLSKTIANFLDYETAQIDTLIDKQQTLIQLLKEKRQAVISHAVTKGLNPDAPMKDSGVEWLGEVPEHWEFIKFDYVINAVGDIDHYMPKSIDSGIPYVMTGDLRDLVSEIDFENCKQVAYSDYVKLSRKIKASKDDIIFARYATIGTLSYVDVDADFLVSYSCVTIKPNAERTSGRYLFRYLKSQAFLQAITMYINSNTQGNVGIDSLRNVKVIMPPLSEQEEIINFLNDEVMKIDQLLNKAKSAITLMQERRTALISAAVTGKIDVRGWVAPA